MATRPPPAPLTPVLRLPLSPEALIGPWLIGGMFSAAMAGATVLSAIRYFQRYRRDGWYYQITVALLTSISVFGYAMAIRILWFYIFQARNDDMKLAASPVYVFTPIGIIPFSSTISQAFFGRRSYLLAGRKKFVGFALFILVLASFATGLAAIIDVCRRPFLFLTRSNTKFFPKEAKGVYDHDYALIAVYLWVSTLTDFVITILLANHLRKNYSQVKEFHQQTAKTLVRLILLSLATGALSTVMSAGVAILDQTLALHNNGHIAFVLLMPHVYAMVVIGSLHIRQSQSDPWANQTLPNHHSQSSGRHHRTFSLARGSVDPLAVSNTSHMPNNEKHPVIQPPGQVRIDVTKFVDDEGFSNHSPIKESIPLSAYHLKDFGSPKGIPFPLHSENHPGKLDV